MAAEAKGIRLLVTGGGTGGHLFPGIAVAETLMERLPESRVLFVTPGRPVDIRGLAGRGFEHEIMAGHGLKGTGLGERLKALAGLPLALSKALALIGGFRPDLVLGVGGYVTGPVIVAARMRGVPACIHEQNSVPGLANRLLARIVSRVLVSMPVDERYFPAGKTVLTGNPVRRDFLAKAWDKRAGSLAGAKRLFVTGGSQGAHRVNTLMCEAVGFLPAELRGSLYITHQTGRDDADMVARHYVEAGITARVEAFLEDMADCYAGADLVLARAGATTLAEITVLGRASILIPYPYAADNHQEKNGAQLVAAGAARMFKQEELDGKKLAGALAELLIDDAARSRMAKAALGLGRPEAAAAIVDQCVALARS